MSNLYSTRGKVGFTLVELLVSMAILTLLLLVLVSITDATQRTWSYTTGKVEQFRDAREAFESITRKLGQATLNTYWDYHYPAGTNVPPDRYMRQSELRFISGNLSDITTGDYPNSPTHAMFFQAPLGYVNDSEYAKLDTLLNTWGYFIEFGSDKSWRPDFFSTLPRPPAERYRFRVMELMEPSEQLTLYSYTSGTNSSGATKNSAYKTTEWFTDSLSLPLPPDPPPNRPVRVVADNVLALVLLPKLTQQEDSTGATLCPNYTYNSVKTDDNNSATVDPAINWKNQLPPVVQVTMVAVDEASFNRFLKPAASGTATMPDYLFKDKSGQKLFQSVGDTVNSANPGYAKDLETLQQNLQAYKLNYRVFTTNVSIKAAKWSREQKN